LPLEATSTFASAFPQIERLLRNGHPRAAASIRQPTDQAISVGGVQVFKSDLTIDFFVSYVVDGLSVAHHVLQCEIRPPSPRSEATVCAVTMRNITELSATAFLALFIDSLSLRMTGYHGEVVRRRECQSTPIEK
jgi:hypothetical protein